MHGKRSALLWVLLLAVAALLLVPGLGQAQECNPNHPETCECDPYHPDTCPTETATHGAAFMVAEKSDPGVASDLKLAGVIALAVIGVALVTRMLITNASRD